MMCESKVNVHSPDDWESVEMPTANIVAVNYYKYRRYGRVVAEIFIKTSVGEFRLFSQRARRQFLTHLGLGYRQISGIMDWKERNAVIMGAIAKRQDAEKSKEASTLVFRCVATRMYGVVVESVVTKEYVEVPTAEAIDTYEQYMTDHGFVPKVVSSWQDTQAMYRTYLLVSRRNNEVLRVGDLAECGVTLRVGYSGDRSIGLIPYWRILACMNGLMSNQQTTVYRGVHRGATKEEILLNVQRAFDHTLKDVFKIGKIIEDAREPLTTELELEILNKVLKEYPDHVRYKVIDALRVKYIQESGLFRLSQALSDVATHDRNLTDNYRRQMSQDAFRVLLIRKKDKKKEGEQA